MRLPLLLYTLALASAQVDPNPPAPDDALDAWTCDAASARQQWVLTASTVALANSTFLLAATSNASNSPLVLLAAASAPAWAVTFTLADNVLRHAASGRCATINPGATLPVTPAGAPVVLGACDLPAAGWTRDGALLASSLPAAGLCLDARTRVSCATLDWATHAYCNASLARSVRRADLAARITPSDAILLMSRLRGVPRLGVPDLFYFEALHGVRSSACLPSPAPNSTGCATSFPVPLAQAASFNRSLWHAVASAIGDEARAMYNIIPGPATATLMYYAPNSNVFMNPLWGRGMETAGEDPTVLSEFAAAFIDGMQTSAEEPRFAKVGATLKHWIAVRLAPRCRLGCRPAVRRNLTCPHFFPHSIRSKRSAGRPCRPSRRATISTPASH